jgi:hypothetical protein
MSAFDKLRNKAAQMEKLSNKITQEKSGYDDSRFWKLSVDKKQTGSAIIRFLPASDGEEFPYVKLYEHAFEWPRRGSGQWFVEPCPTTIERDDCPCCAANNEEWQKGTDAAKDVARNRKRNLSYIANIYVVDDPAKPENNGKVFLFKFGARIFQKIEGALKPEFADIQAINPFDLWEGANFKLRARELDGQRSYDMSAFDSCAPLADDATMEKIWLSQYKLLDEIAPSKFKSPTELLAKWNKIMGIKAAGSAAPAEEGTTGSFQRRSDATPQPAQQPAPQQQAPVEQQSAENDPPFDVDPPAPASQPAAAAPKPAAPTGGGLADKYRSMLGKK